MALTKARQTLSKIVNSWMDGQGRRRMNRGVLDFYQTFITPGSLCLDVGANVGARTDIFLQLGARVICVEPQKDCIQVLRARYKHNRRVEILEVGLAARPGTMTLSVCKSANTISTFSEKWKTGRFSAYQWNEQYEVPVKTLDEVVSQYGVPDFCKIDVEGFELEVLKGLSAPIRLLSFEFTREFIQDARQCVDRLESLGKVGFNFALGDNLIQNPRFEIKDWVGGEQLFREIQSVPAPTLWGDIYAQFRED